MLKRLSINLLYVIYPLAICILPILVLGLPFFYLENIVLKSIWLGLSPLTFIFSFVLVAGFLSIPAQKAIIMGKFPRDVNHPIYGIRRLYSLCWTAVFYSGPIYYFCLSIPCLRKILLRLFGYKGSLDIVFYPDTWIRDLPLLQIEKKVYLANKSTIGSNMCRLPNDIIVGTITIKEGAMIGHLAAIALNCTIEENVEIGVGSQVGIGAFVGKNTKVGTNTVICHYAKIGENVLIGYCCFIGMRSIIKPGIIITSGTVIPDKTIIRSQEEADVFNHTKP